MGTLIAVEMGMYAGTKPTRAGVSQAHRVNPEASHGSPRGQTHTDTDATAPVGVGWALGLAWHELVQRTLISGLKTWVPALTVLLTVCPSLLMPLN